MVSRKRNRDDSDVDGEVEIEIEIESASSSFRHQGQPKRSRVTLARENGGSVISDDEDDLDPQREGDWTEGTPASLPSHYSGDERDEDTLELQATQFVSKTMTGYRDNKASDQGVIEEVFCRNFMCHSKLRIKLGPLINFIIGHNGSGKSAVLTALTMCLGGKASSTNRGASLKTLIKEGEESATLSVKIKNQGEGAYKRDLYGDSIIVERNFTRAGTSGFKLKGANDKVISTKKADLDDILDFFAFQLDNPINVLTQDMARQFLSNSSPSDKYKFFIRGTQLEVLDADYKLMEEHLDSISAKLHSRNEDIDALKKKEEDAERKKKRSERTNTIIQQITALHKQHAWAQVEEQEQILERYKIDVQLAAQVIQEKTEEAENVEGVYEGHNQSYEAARRMVEEFQEQLRPLTDKHAVEKEKFDKVKSELFEKTSEERVIKTNMTSSKSTVKKYETDIRKEQTRLAEAEGPEHAERLRELEELKASAEQKKQEQDDHSSGSTELLRMRDQAQQQLDLGRQRYDQMKEDLDKADGRLKALQQNQGRRFAGYRPNMDRLVGAINGETRWRSKPAGPMGEHIRIKKTEWTSQIERTLGGNMEAFIVTCKEDQALLSDVMKRVGCSSPIFIGHAARLDTTGKDPVESIDTVLRVLHIDNDLVRNSLIINQAAEQIALIQNRNEAHAFMYRNERPRNVRAALALSEDKRGAVRFEFSGRGAEKSSFVPPWDGQSRMKIDLGDQTRMRREEREQAFHDFENAKQNKNSLQQASERAKQGVVRFERTAKDLKTQFQQAEDAIDQKKAEIESKQPQDGKLQELERQLTEAKDELEAQEQSYLDMTNAKDDLNKTQRQFKDGLDAATTELDQGKARVTKVEKRLQRLEEARIKALQDKNMALELIDDSKRALDEEEQKAETQQRTVENFVANAEKISRRIRVDDGLTSDIIDKRIEKFIKDRERAEAEAGGTIEDLLLAWHHAKNEYEEAKAQTHEMEVFAKTLSNSLSHRKTRWELFRRLISARARATFKYLLSERQFRGRVSMNHEEKLLDIAVEPDLSKVSDAGRATKTLSGGEKSFSTICLLLSIWEAMGSPIRCLDEFDVFMDNVNRATSMAMMIQAARRSVGRQFILITPQAMNNVEMGDNVKVHKMSDPERGQTTLAFA